MQTILSRLSRPTFVFLLFFFLGLVDFGSNLRSEFMIDDAALITDQSSVESPQLKNFYQHFIPDFKSHKKIEDAPPAAYYRPLAHVIPFLQFAAFGFDPVGYHFTNIVLFALACFCFYLLLAALGHDRRLALLAALLFCLHPINGLMVNYITASVYAVQLITLSLGIIFVLKEFPAPALVMFVLSLLCHETSLMFPAYVFLVYWSREKKVGPAVKKGSPFLIIVFLYLGMRFCLANHQSMLMTRDFVDTAINPVNYTATFFKLLSWYFTKLFVLQSPVIIWSTPLVTDKAGLWLAGGIVVIALAILVFRRWKEHVKAVYVLWFILGLVPVTLGCLFLPRTGMMIEPHWLFFASFGLFAIFAGMILQITDKLNAPLRLIGLAALFCLFMIASWNNNELWKDELTFTRHWAAEAPTNKNALFCYANALFNRGYYPQAQEGFLRSLMNEHNDWQNYNNLAAIALHDNDEAQAMIYFQKALAVFPRSATVHNNLGTYYIGKKNWEKAEEYLLKARAFNPYQPEPLLNLGLVFEVQGRWDDVWKSYLTAYDLRPQDERVVYALLRTALKGRGHDEFIFRAEEFLPQIRSENLLNELGGLLAVHGNDRSSLKFFLKSIVLYPQRTTAYREAGKVLANAGYFEEAKKIWEEGSRICPADQELESLLKELAALRSQPKV